MIRAGEMVSRVSWRLIQAAGEIFDWWNSLDTQSKKVITTFSAFTAAIWALNRAFFSSPIGIITGLVAALLLLWDDYQTWKEGGKSFIDWSKWGPEIEQAKKVFKWLRDKFLELKDNLGGWENTLTLLFGFLAGAKLVSMLTGIGRLIAGFTGLGKAIGSSIGGLGKLAQGIAQLAIKNPWLLMFVPANNTPTTTEEMTELDRLKRRNWEANNPGLPFPESGGMDAPAQYGQSVKRPIAKGSGKALLGWMAPAFAKLEALYNLPAGLLNSVATRESGGNQFAVSGSGAKGLFQFMDGTARDMGLKGNDVFDPAKSAQAAARYLSQLLNANGGSLEKALASYNWGLGNVRKHGMALMPQETRNYIPSVLSNMPGAGGSGIQQETTINVYGATDPMATGMDIAGRQTSVNARLIGQTKQRAY